MTPTPTTDEWGIDASWLDALDEEHSVAQATIDRLREVIGTPPADLEERAPIVARPGDALEVDEADVVCEDGEVRHIDGELPADFPLGYHWLQSAEGRRRRLIVSPGRCWLPDGPRLGLGGAALRHPQPGELGHRRPRRPARRPPDGRRPGRRLRADQPAARRRPDAPARRRAPTCRPPAASATRSTCGSPRCPAPTASTSRTTPAGRCPTAPLIDRDAIWARKREVLMRIFFAHGGGEAFARWREEQGQTLQDWATWAAIAEEHGGDWHTWPEELRRPDGPGGRPTTSSSTAPSSASTPGCSGRWTCSSPPRPAT